MVLLLWFGLPIVALVLALLPNAPRWLLAVPCLVLLAIGVWSRITEPAGYDMPWFGLMFYSFLAVVAAVAAIVGATLRRLVFGVPPVWWTRGF